MNPRLVETFAELERRHWWFRARRKILLDIAERTVCTSSGKDPLRIADIGCGPGANMAAFADLGNVVGVDATPEMVAAARAGVGARVITATAEATGLPGAAFDLVLCLDVLEHLEDDAAALAECRRITAPGGYAIITVPAARFLWSRHDVESGHLRRYERASLVRLCRRVGFRMESCSYFNTLLFVPAMLVRLAMPGRGIGGSDFKLKSGFINRLLESVFALEARLLRHFEMPFGMSLAAVLRRPETGGGRKNLDLARVEPSEKLFC